MTTITGTFDVHQMIRTGEHYRWVSTVSTNNRYTIAKAIKRIKESKPNKYAKGMFFIIVPNGTKDPIQWLRNDNGKFDRTIEVTIKKYKFRWAYGYNVFETVSAGSIDNAIQRLAIRTRHWAPGYTLFSITK